MTTAFGGSPILSIAPLPTEPLRDDGTPAPDLVAPKPSETRKSKRAAIMPAASLTEDVAALTARMGRAFGVPVKDGYDTDLFIQAVGSIHDTLAGVRKDLGEWQAALEAREASIAAREAAVQEREQRAEALATLAGLLPAGGAPRATGSGLKKWVRQWLMA